jgi:hypothetical protein
MRSMDVDHDLFSGIRRVCKEFHGAFEEVVGICLDEHLGCLLWYDDCCVRDMQSRVSRPTSPRPAAAVIAFHLGKKVIQKSQRNAHVIAPELVSKGDIGGSERYSSSSTSEQR